MRLDNVEEREREMELLLSEIPHAIPPHFSPHSASSSLGSSSASSSSSSSSLSAIAGKEGEDGLIDDDQCLGWLQPSSPMQRRGGKPETDADFSLFQTPNSPPLFALQKNSSLADPETAETASDFMNPNSPLFCSDFFYNADGVSKGFDPVIGLSKKLARLDPYQGPNALDYLNPIGRKHSKHRHIETPVQGIFAGWNDGSGGYGGAMYGLAKDQHGCRFLQKKVDEGKHQVEVVLSELIDHVSELMVDPFASYLMQKLFEVCSKEQVMRILLVLTEFPDTLVTIASNVHGTRAVQKLIENLKTNQQITLVMLALRPGFLGLMKDLNGYHVIKHCLNYLKEEDNKLIFDAAIMHSADIATHRHGCCVLQCCIASSTGAHQANLIAKVLANGLWLAQDAFGNYVVQYILGLGTRSAISSLASQFAGSYLQLSMQKFSSNVVEKCFKVFGEDDKANIVFELLSSSQFEQLLQHPYANYVVQSALANTKGPLHSALVGAIRPHAAVLRTSPYCKRIFTRTLSKNCCAF